jgi:hypothetical protein
MTRNAVLFICEKYFLRFYRPLADRLFQFGFSPLWITLDGADQWDYDYLDPGPAIEELTERPDLQCRPSVDALCALERTVFERPDVFRTATVSMNVVRTFERARRLAESGRRRRWPSWRAFSRGRSSSGTAGISRRAVSAACEAAGQRSSRAK